MIPSMIGRCRAGPLGAALAIGAHCLCVVLPTQAQVTTQLTSGQADRAKPSEPPKVTSSVPSAVPTDDGPLSAADKRRLRSYELSRTARPSALRSTAVVRTDSTIGRGTSLGIVTGMYAGLYVLAYLAWYQDSRPDHFQWVSDGWFAPNAYAGGADKLGHYFMNHFLTRANAEVLESGGWHPRSSTFAGATLALGAYYVLEMQDGVTYGFSTNDMIANVAGAATGVLFREFPTLDRMFDTRVEYVPSSDYLRQIKRKGFNFNEDYTGLTFLLAWHLCSVPFIEQNGSALRFMDLTLGYNARNYKPRPNELSPTRYQDRFIGVSLNLQRVIDELWTGERHPSWGASAGRTHGVVHFATEFFNLPYTSVRLGTWRTEFHGRIIPQFQDP